MYELEKYFNLNKKVITKEVGSRNQSELVVIIIGISSNNIYNRKS